MFAEFLNGLLVLAIGVSFAAIVGFSGIGFVMLLALMEPTPPD